MINKLIGAVLAIVVGVIMLPIVIETGRGITHDVNGVAIDLPTGVAELIGLLPLLFVVIIVGGVVAYFKFKD